MSLTGTHHIFGGISETGIDHFLDVFFTARPHLLAYGTPHFANNPNQITLIDTSSLPSYLQGLQVRISFTIPTVDITPPNSAAELLPPGADQFTVFTTAQIDFLCGTRRDGDKGGHETELKLDIAILCQPRIVNATPGTGSIGLTLVQLKIAGIGSPPIEEILECILTAIMTWALSQLIIPFNVFTIDGISLTLQQGPVSADNEIEVFGDIT